jgi:hypothetical protein
MLLLTGGTRFLGYESPNHNADGALTKMVEETMLVKATNKVGTEVYYLGNLGRQSLQRDKVPNVDSRQGKYRESINIHSDNGHRVRKKTSYSENILHQQATRFINFKKE